NPLCECQPLQHQLEKPGLGFWIECLPRVLEAFFSVAPVLRCLERHHETCCYVGSDSATRFCAPSSADRGWAATLPRPPARNRARRRRPRVRRDREPAPLQIEEQLTPGLRTLAHAVVEANRFLLALGRSADDDQQALRVVLEPGLHIDAVARSSERWQ